METLIILNYIELISAAEIYPMDDIKETTEYRIFADYEKARKWAEL